jgi:hypothetical protein
MCMSNSQQAHKAGKPAQLVADVLESIGVPAPLYQICQALTGWQASDDMIRTKGLLTELMAAGEVECIEADDDSNHRRYRIV